VNKAGLKGKKLAAAVVVIIVSMGTLAVYARTGHGADVASFATDGGDRPEAGTRIASLTDTLDTLAERERSEGLSPGMALAESALRERAGDFAGSTVAAFKELRWAYAMGSGGTAAVTAKQIQERLSALEKLFAGRDDEAATEAIAASRAVSAFVDGRWKEARTKLESLFRADDEADSFARWMILVCSLEEGEADRVTRTSYAAIRARYGRFPEYWFRSARAEAARSGGEPASSSAASASAMDAAERCVTLAPKGPFAVEARSIMAESAGLPRADGVALLTRAEIEAAIVTATNQGEPKRLEVLFPLLALPDNAYTLYALGAVRGLSSDGSMRSWLVSEASRASGRLAERLRYAAGK
jgi:hypothetical protein